MHNVIIRYSVRKLFRTYLILLISGLPLVLILVGYSMNEAERIDPQSKVLLELATLGYYLLVTIYYFVKRHVFLSKRIIELNTEGIVILEKDFYTWSEIQDVRSLTKVRKIHSRNPGRFTKQRYTVLKINNEEYEFSKEYLDFTTDEIVQLLMQFKLQIENENLLKKS